jgi:hypothetical protein
MKKRSKIKPFPDGERRCPRHIVGLFNYLTRLADGFGLQLDAGTKAAAESGVALKRPE